MSTVLALQAISKTFTQGETIITLWDNLSLTLDQGEIVGLVGASGAGKTTLLHIAGLLERPSHGEIVLKGNNCQHLSDYERTIYRRQYLGFVYQAHLLLPEFSASENVMLPQYIAGASKAAAQAKAQDLLASLGLSHRLHHRPQALSGGEQQRVAIARALANNPSILLADEPTGNLDGSTAAMVFMELMQLVRQQGLATLVATHNLELARQMDRVLLLKDGQLETVQS